ncbi:hypothetical protein SPURM210S_00687 [Streptomyces purpurascens]
MTRPRRPAHPTRARILEAAGRELGRDPDSSLTDIAEAAGVVRRTVYAHFAGRSALVEGLATEAAEALRHALATVAAPVPTTPPPLYGASSWRSGPSATAIASC